jgi:hypothetical protein
VIVGLAPSWTLAGLDLADLQGAGLILVLMAIFLLGAGWTRDALRRRRPPGPPRSGSTAS